MTRLFAAFLLLPQLATAQENIDFSGLAFGDYYYTLSSPDENEEGANGFTFRRLYLTTDFSLSERFSGRARLEAADGNLSGKGMDTFVKDLYLRYRSEGGHSIRIGIIPIPHYDTSEDVWAFRSLEKTPLDLYGIASSRDAGVRVDGPLTGDDRFGYSLMFANDSGTLPETNEGKRVYGQFQARPVDNWIATVGADYAGPNGDRDDGITLHAFLGYETDQLTVGIEPFWSQVSFEAGTETRTYGAALFGHVLVAEDWRVVGRVDLSQIAAGDADLARTFGLVAVSYEPTASVRLMPNLWLMTVEGSDAAELMGRFTFEFSF